MQQQHKNETIIHYLCQQSGMSEKMVQAALDRSKPEGAFARKELERTLGLRLDL